MIALLSVGSVRKDGALHVQFAANLHKIIAVVVGLVFLPFTKKELNRGCQDVKF